MKALLLDLDGTLVDSHAPTEAAWSAWGAAHGLDGDEVARTCHGVPSVEHVRTYAPGLDAQAEADRIETAQAESDAATPAYEGAADLLRAADKVAIVTSATPALAAKRLRNAGLTAPAVMIRAGEVERGKPAPDPYLLAAERLGVDPADCVVVEDAPAGIAAGRAAGARVLAVTHTHARDDLAGADAVYDDLPALLRALGYPGAAAPAP
jgi:sugar-phosphatase